MTKLYCDICGHTKKRHIDSTCMTYNVTRINFSALDIPNEFKKSRCPCGPEPNVKLDKKAFKRWMQLTDLSTNIFFPEISIK
jgi:hypothetical protein